MRAEGVPASARQCRFRAGMSEGAFEVRAGGVMVYGAGTIHMMLYEAARCLRGSLADGKIAGRCCGPLGKTAGLRGTSGTSQGLVGNVPTRQSSRPGLDGGVMLYFETDL